MVAGFSEKEKANSRRRGRRVFVPSAVPPAHPYGQVVGGGSVSGFQQEADFPHQAGRYHVPEGLEFVYGVE